MNENTKMVAFILVIFCIIMIVFFSYKMRVVLDHGTWSKPKLKEGVRVIG